MPSTTRTTAISVPDGQMDVFIAEPEGTGPHPGLLVIMEAFGVNDHIRDVAQRLANQGYMSVAPDFYHRLEQRTVPYSDMQTAISSVMTLRDGMVMDDVNAALAYLKSQPHVTADRIGIIGFCFGGRTSYLAATRSREVAAAVGYYGGGIADPRNPNAPVTRTKDIEAPILLFFGGQDQMIPRDRVHEIEQALQREGKEHRVKMYPQAGHGFNCDARGAYNKEAAEDAWGITLGFLKKHLG